MKVILRKNIGPTSPRGAHNRPKRRVISSKAVTRELPEGDLGLPVLGETLSLIVSGDTFGTTRRAKYGDVYKTNILGAPTVMVYGEDAVRTVLAAEDKLVATDWPQVTSTLVGPDSLNLLTGQRHGAVKRALYEAFSERQMRRHVPRMAQLVQEYLERWATGPQPTLGYASCQELSQAVFDAVVLGGDGGRQRATQLQDLMARLQAGFQTPPLDLPFTAYGKAVAARREFSQLVSDTIARSRGTHTNASADCALADIVTSAAAAAAAANPETGSGAVGSGTTSTPAAASAESQPPATAVSLLPDSVLVDNMAAAFFGNASTGPSLCKALQYLAASPVVLERLRAEQQDLIARHGTAITAEVLDEMSYGSAVARELLRITPAVPAVFRVALVDFELQGRLIPKGWRVWSHLGDAVLKYNRDTFDPDRWLRNPPAEPAPPSPTEAGPAASLADPQPPQPQPPPPSPTASTAAAAPTCPVRGLTGPAAAAAPEYSLPFGTGVRACLGRNLVTSELLVFLALLARGYEWEMVSPAEEWRLVPAPAPKEGLAVNFRRRR